jgi:prepilin-type N-terminal cleavage/methylation domain-containing protein
MMKLSDKGFTLIELLFAAVIIAFVLCGLLLTYVNMFLLSDLARGFTLTTNGMQLEIERLKNANFTNLISFNNTKFEVAGFNNSDAEGVIYVSDTAYSDLKKARIAVSFKSRKRIIGEDTDLDGTLDYGEDINNNTRLDSPAEVVTLIAD